MADSSLTPLPLPDVKVTPLPLPGPDTRLTPLPLPGSTPELKADGFLDDAARGVKMSLNPFGMTKEELTKPKTLGETVVETGTNILTDIGTSLLAGAAVGSVVPGAGSAAGALTGAAVGLGLAVYRGLGYEAARATAEDREFSPSKAALNVATEANPLFKYSGKAGKFATQGVLQALQAKQYGADNVTAGVAGLVGGAGAALGNNSGFTLQRSKIAGATAMLARPEAGVEGAEHLAETITKNFSSVDLELEDYMKVHAPIIQKTKEVMDLNDLSTNFSFEAFVASKPADELAKLYKDLNYTPLNLSKDLDKSARAYVKGILKSQDEALIEQYKAYQIYTADLQGMAVYYLGGTKKSRRLQDRLAKQLRGRGVDLQKVYEGYSTFKGLVKSMDKLAKAHSDALKLGDDPMDNFLLRKTYDLVFASRAIERATGVGVEPLTNAIHYASQRHSSWVVPYMDDVVQFSKRAKRLKLNSAEIYRRLDDPAVSWKQEFAEGSKEYQLLDDIVGWFDKLKKEARANNLAVADYLPGKGSYGYVPKAMAANDVLLAKLNSIAERANLDGAGPLREDYVDELKELIGALTQKHPRTKDQMLQIVNDIRKNPSKLKKTDGYMASATFQRKGSIPEDLLETDIFTLMGRYANNIGKTIHMNPVLDELRPVISALDVHGFKSSAKYLRRVLKEYSGQQVGLVNTMDNLTTRYKAWVRGLMEDIDPSAVRGQALQAGLYLPDLFSWSLGQLYPNFLGARIDAPLRNLTQNLFLTAPEIGGLDGYKFVFKGAMKVAKRLKREGYSGVKQWLEDIGHAPGRFMGHGMNPATESLAETPFGWFVRFGDWFGDKMMTLYSATDVLNRAITYHTAEELSDALLRGNTQAMRFVENLSSGYKSRVTTALKAKDAVKVKTLLADFLISKTQFNYGRHAGAELGRDLGRLGTMFSKWPAMLWGEVSETATSNRTLGQKFSRYTHFFFATAALLVGLDALMEETKDSPRRQVILGKSFKTWAVSNSLLLSAPPITDVASDTLESILGVMSLDFENYDKYASKVGKHLYNLAPSYLHLPAKIYERGKGLIYDEK